MTISQAPSHRRAESRAASRAAFTLVELLVVIGIIALLISILMPALRRAREAANGVVCSSNQQKIIQAFLMFANEHKGHLPGNWWDFQNTDPDKRAWLINAGEPFANAPQGGTIFRYLNEQGVYRCPSLIDTTLSSGTGSNGRFDTAAFLVFSGAKITSIRPTSRFTFNGTTEILPTPIICEEEAQGGINGGNNEGGHCNTDRMAHTHPNSGWQLIGGKPVARGGSYYASVDGSIHYFREPWEANSWAWFSQAPSGKFETLGSIPNPSWGYWNTR